MKKTLLATIGLVSLVSANAFAADIAGGKLMSHKEWTTGAVSKAVFKDSKVNVKKPVLPPKLNKFNNQTDLNQYVFSWSKVTDFDPGDGNILGAYTSALYANFLENYTDTQQVYNVSRTICLIKTKDMAISYLGCAYSTDQYFLDPHGYVSTGNSVSLYASLGEKDPQAVYEVQTTTYVTNELGAIQFISFDGQVVDVNSPLKK